MSSVTCKKSKVGWGSDLDPGEEYPFHLQHRVQQCARAKVREDRLGLSKITKPLDTTQVKEKMLHEYLIRVTNPIFTFLILSSPRI